MGLLDFFRSSLLKVGDAAPDFSLPDQNGKQICLKEFQGKRLVVVFFYPADETAICTKEACAFRDSHEQFSRVGAEVIGISSDSNESHASFAKNHKLPYRLVSDAGGALRKLFGVPATLGLIPGRVTFVIDKKGIIRHVYNSQIFADAHVSEALAVVQKLLAEK